MAERLYNGSRVMLATGDAMRVARARTRDLAQGYADLRAASANLAAERSRAVSVDERLARARAARAAVDALLAD